MNATQHASASPIVAALAGRRIDAENASDIRFPLSRVGAVRIAIQSHLRKNGLGLLICSAACGADLIALDVAITLGVRCRIILPFDRDKFRRTSVTDRPGDWGNLYDRIISHVAKAGDLIVLHGDPVEEDAYNQANRSIIDNALVAGTPHRASAIIVWEGQQRTGQDATSEFRSMAVSAGMSEYVINTLSD